MTGSEVYQATLLKEQVSTLIAVMVAVKYHTLEMVEGQLATKNFY